MLDYTKEYQSRGPLKFVNFWRPKAAAHQFGRLKITNTCQSKLNNKNLAIDQKNYIEYLNHLIVLLWV